MIALRSLDRIYSTRYLVSISGAFYALATYCTTKFHEFSVSRERRSVSCTLFISLQCRDYFASVKKAGTKTEEKEHRKKRVAKVPTFSIFVN
mmetsp:Transcript_17827/g.44033  ORF Transcript_17827/g.44033 Transcript_17827/m.44033 type:complete len:92 (-) Transcript_17827:149-424(-)